MCTAALGHSQNTPEQSETANDGISLAPTLLAPIALLSSDLTLLSSTLPQVTMTSVYRRIASHLALHILPRAITFRGRARITPQEGRTILAESELWVSTCRLALSRNPGRADVPWRPLLQAARIVGAQGEQWDAIVDATLGTAADQEWEDAMVQHVGFAKLGREEVGQIIRTRSDCVR